MAANRPIKPSEYPTNFSLQSNFSIVKKVHVLWVACCAILNNTIQINNPDITGYLFNDINVPIGLALLISNFLLFFLSNDSGKIKYP